MEFELKDIKGLRKKFNLTQHDLAKRADVSQSLIAKIEAGRIDPTYSNAVKIFSALKFLSEKDEVKVSSIMTSKIIFVCSDSSVVDVIQKMKKYSISQIPVIDDGKVVGLLSESIILDAFMKDKSAVKVKDIMIDAPPTISKDASLSVASNLLRHYPMIVVLEKGKILGLLTKADVINSFSPKKRYGLF